MSMHQLSRVGRASLDHHNQSETRLNEQSDAYQAMQTLWLQPLNKRAQSQRQLTYMALINGLVSAVIRHSRAQAGGSYPGNFVGVFKLQQTGSSTLDRYVCPRTVIAAKPSRLTTHAQVDGCLQQKAPELGRQKLLH